jgi:hypothetical protein
MYGLIASSSAKICKHLETRFLKKNFFFPQPPTPIPIVLSHSLPC